MNARGRIEGDYPGCVRIYTWGVRKEFSQSSLLAIPTYLTSLYSIPRSFSNPYAKVIHARNMLDEFKLLPDLA